MWFISNFIKFLENWHKKPYLAILRLVYNYNLLTVMHLSLFIKNKLNKTKKKISYINYTNINVDSIFAEGRWLLTVKKRTYICHINKVFAFCEFN